VIVVCPKCGATNRIPDPPEPSKTYRCGKCKARLAYTPKAPDARDKTSAIRQPVTEEGNKRATKVAGIVLLCLTLVGLAALAASAITEKISVNSKEGLEIVMSPDDGLREVAIPVDIDKIGEEEQQLAALMTNTMEKADVVGLAAPQVGVSKRIAVVKLERPSPQEEILVMVNPEIIEREGSVSGMERCPSISGTKEKPIRMTRSERITVKYWTLEGEEVVLQEEGSNARVIQHQIDHLDGVLISDYARPFNITPQVLAAISILVVFFFIETRSSLLSDTIRPRAVRDERSVVRQVVTMEMNVALLYLLGITVAELLLSGFDSLLGAVFYTIVLIALVTHYLRATEYRSRVFYLSLALVPFYRLTAVLAAGVTSALDIDSDLASFALMFSLLLVAAVVLMRIMYLGAREVGFAVGKPPSQLAMGLTGIIFGPALYYIVEPEPLIPEFAWGMLIIAVFVILIGAAVEELTFRGILQRTSMESFGHRGLLYVSLVFAFIHFGHISGMNLSVASIPFIFAIALFYGWVVKKTGSLFGVILSHAITNIIFFLIAPLWL